MPTSPLFLAKAKKNRTTSSSTETNPYPIPLGHPYMYYNYPYQSYQMQMPPPPPPPLHPTSNSLHTGYNYNSLQYNTNRTLTLPSIEKLLKDLDQTHGEGTYTKYSEEFLKEKITVNVIPTLDNDDLISLGVNTIGERKILVQAAKFYLG